MLADGDADGIPILIGVKEPKKESKSKKAEEESKKASGEGGGKDDKEKEKGKDKGEEKREEKGKSGGKEGDVGAGTGDRKAGKESASAADDNPDQYEGEEGDGAQKKAKGGGRKGGKGENVGEMMEKILERLDDMEGEGGKFNETLEKQEAVLETVARVGKHHVHEKEEKEREEREKQEQEEAEREAELKAKQEAEAAAAAAKNSWDGGVTGGGERSFFDILLGIDAVPPPPPPPRPTPKNVTKASARNETKKEQEAEQEDEKDVPRLIDSQDNEYVISSPGKGSKMQLQEDFTLISDIVKVIVAAALGGLACGLMGQPIILGYIVAGMAIGPGGLGLIHELVQVSRITTCGVTGRWVLGGLACGLMGQPIILGYIVAGMAIGPGRLGLIHELVQVETLAQFGVVFLLFARGIEFSLANVQGVHNVETLAQFRVVFLLFALGVEFSLAKVETLAQFGVVFLLFALGVEFSLAKMQGVHNVALGGGVLQIAIAMILGGIFSSNTPQGLFIGGFLSMSSTAVVLKCLVDINGFNSEHGQIMLGTLIAQDCALGLLLAIMPALAARPASASAILLALVRELLILLAFCLVAWALSRLLVPRFLRLLVRVSRGNNELYQLGIMGNCLCVALLSEYLGLSLEVGAFIAGLMLSGGTYSERTLHQVEPVRNMFAALFLASIGMVMHPMFLWQHKDILLLALAVVFLGKTLLVALVHKDILLLALAVVFLGKTLLVALVVREGVGGWACGGHSTDADKGVIESSFPLSLLSTPSPLHPFNSAGTAAAVGIALAQIGEFSFVLLSRAQTLKLVGHKLYLLLMGTTALSLVLTPFAFKLVPRLAAIGAHQDRARLMLKNKRAVWRIEEAREQVREVAWLEQVQDLAPWLHQAQQAQD
ncbi:unnamed protein product [Closterium sp. NIES-65]|nr:unnamed protein product [Closterium sp. NIES-65]